MVIKDFNLSYFGSSGMSIASSSPTTLLFLKVKKKKLAKMYFRI